MNDDLGVLFDAVSAQTGAPVPPPGLPGPFSLEDRDELAALLADAELAEVAVSEVPEPLTASSFEEWWSVVPALAGPLAKLIATMPEEAARAIRAHAQKALADYETPGGGLEIPGVTLVATARRA